MQTHAEVIRPGGLAQILIPLAVFAVIFAFRARRMTRVRPLKPGQLWIMPAIVALMAVVAFVATPPRGLGWLIAAAALLVGAALGWQRGRMMHIEVDPETGELRQRASPVALLFLILLVVVKSAARAEGAAMRLDVATLSDALLALAVGMFALMRVEMYLRAKRLAEDHRRAVFS